MLLLSACVGTAPCADGYGRLASGACVPLAVDETETPLTEDTGATTVDSEDTGEPIDSGPFDTAPPQDTEEPPLDTALSEPPPWATVTNMERFGDLPCENPNRPCNHQLRLAVADGDELVELDFDFAFQGSVASAMVIDHGELDGLNWVELQVVYLDFYQPNFGRGDESNPARASIAFPLEAVDGVDDLAEILSEQRAYTWVFRTMDIDLGPRLIDPEPILIELDDGSRRSFVFGLKEGNDELTLVECEPPQFETCHEIARPLSSVTFSDPDPFPLDWDGDYPGVLPERYLPGGEGGWAFHLSEGPRLRRYEGSLDDLSEGEGREVVYGTGVSGTAMREGVARVYGHSAGEKGDPTSLMAHELENDVYSEGVELLGPSKVNPTGQLSPDRFTLPNGLDAFVFHSLITPHDEFEK